MSYHVHCGYPSPSLQHLLLDFYNSFLIDLPPKLFLAPQPENWFKRTSWSCKSIYPPPLWVWATLSDSLPKNKVGKGTSHNFTVKKPSRHHLNPVIKALITSSKSYECHLLRYVVMRKGPSPISQNNEPKKIMRGHWKIPNWESFYKIHDQYSSKLSQSGETKQDWETDIDWGRLREHED